MKNIINSIILLIVLASCSDFVDLSPHTQWKVEEFYSNEIEVQMALSGIYSQFTVDDMYGFKFNVLLEAGTDESYSNNTTSVWDASRFMYLPSDDLIRGIWTQLYNSINLVNLFEQNLNPDAFEEDEYNLYLAKARFMRGFSYMHLANWWGDVPIRLTPSKVQADNNLSSSPVLEVYKQAEKDFLFAAEHLLHANDSKYLPGEPNSMAARGLLARLYLKMGGYQPYLSLNESENYFPDNQQYYQKALEQCDIIIYQDGWHDIVPFSEDSLSYRNHFLSYIQDRYDLKESLFEISFGSLSHMGINVHGRMGNINGVDFRGTDNIPRGFSNINVSIVLYNLYLRNPEDKRMEWNIAGFRNSYTATRNEWTINYSFNQPLRNRYSIGKFRRWEPVDMELLKELKSVNGENYKILNDGPSATDPNFTSINFPILRYSDVLLMYAEAAIGGRFGNIAPTQKALDCINKVRNRAGLNNITTTDHNEFFNEIVDERMRELCFEALRKQDLIRWNLYEEKLEYTAMSIKNESSYLPNDATHNEGYLGASNNFDKSKHLTLPYPLQEVEINKLIEQKDNWK